MSTPYHPYSGFRLIPESLRLQRKVEISRTRDESVMFVRCARAVFVCELSSSIRRVFGGRVTRAFLFRSGAVMGSFRMRALVARPSPRVQRANFAQRRARCFARVDGS